MSAPTAPPEQAERPAVFAALADDPVFTHFGELVRTPRPSKHEELVQNVVAEWGRSRGYRVTRDATGNLCLHVPATSGCESAPTVVVQNHTDIVVSNAADAPPGADSATGRIPVDRGDVDESGTFVPQADGAWLRAPHTTLGADNGIGCAMAMALVEEPDAVHPPLELLFTVDEEQGLTGALRLDAKALGLTGRTLLNLDTEDDDELTVGCAGGMDTEITWNRAKHSVPDDFVALTVKVGPTRGGHSGIEVDKGRANAIRVLARVLRKAADEVALHLVSFDGGDKRNAIPREARAVVCVPAADEPKLREVVTAMREEVAPQYDGRDVDLRQAIADPERVDSPGTAFVTDSTHDLLNLLLALPAGVLATTPEIVGLVETSNNLALVSTQGDTVQVACNSRSSSAAALRDVAASLRATAWLAGAEAEKTNQYPGWQPNLKSALVQTTRAAYVRLFGEEPKVQAIHAGLECGVLAERIGGEVDSVSFGPNIRGNHAPGERVEIASVRKSYRLLRAVLADLAGQSAGQSRDR